MKDQSLRTNIHTAVQGILDGDDNPDLRAVISYLSAAHTMSAAKRRMEYYKERIPDVARIMEDAE